jgi:hypothetical protein
MIGIKNKHNCAEGGWILAVPAENLRRDVALQRCKSKDVTMVMAQRELDRPIAKAA